MSAGRAGLRNSGWITCRSIGDIAPLGVAAAVL